MNQNAQPGRVSRQLEQPQDPYDGERLQQARLLAHPLAHVGVEAKCCREVDDVHRRFDELEYVGCDLEEESEWKMGNQFEGIEVLFELTKLPLQNREIFLLKCCFHSTQRNDNLS